MEFNTEVDADSGVNIFITFVTEFWNLVFGEINSMSIVLILLHTIWWIFISMLGQNMFLHFILCDITFVTEFTRVSLFSSVHFFMLLFASHINEFAFAKLTRKGFHTSVCQFMPFPIAPFTKTFVTNRTCIGFYASVGPFMACPV